MPYSSVSEIPDYVPKAQAHKWLDIFNSVFEVERGKGKTDKEAEEQAFKEANGSMSHHEKSDASGEGVTLSEGAGAPVADSAEKKMPEQVDSSLSTIIKFNFAITKVDEEKREIEGLATAQIVDKQGEVMTYEGSKEAIRNWAGNVREMHQPKAVGRGLLVKFDDEKRLITVRSRISKGAQDTWEKVLDKTLCQYSVKGERQVYSLKKRADVPKEMFVEGSSILDGKSNLCKIADTVVWTEKWRMTELSLVDSGALPMGGFDLVKEVNGEILQTPILESEEVEKKVLTSKERKAMPKSSFGFVDEAGKGHYPVKDSSGKCDPVHTRNALSRAAAARKKGGKSAEIAAKAMPKIRACAKKLKIGAFHEKADLFVATHNISKIEFESDGIVLEAKPGEFLEPAKCLEVAKYYSGEFASSFAYTPVDFETAYERYCESADLQRQYDMTELLQQVIIATMGDPDLDIDGKHTMVAQSTEQFVSIFFEEVAEAADDDEDESEKLDKGDKNMAEPVKAAETVVAPPSALESMMTKFMESVNPATIQKTVETAVAPLGVRIEDISKRLEVVEKTPAAKRDGTRTYRMIEKDGTATQVGAAGDGHMVAVNDAGEEYTLEKCDVELSQIQKDINGLPLGASERTPLEIKFMKINRIKKGLKGDGVWEPRR